MLTPSLSQATCHRTSKIVAIGSTCRATVNIVYSCSGFQEAFLKNCDPTVGARGSLSVITELGGQPMHIVLPKSMFH